MLMLMLMAVLQEALAACVCLMHPGPGRHMLVSYACTQRLSLLEAQSRGKRKG